MTEFQWRKICELCADVHSGLDGLPALVAEVTGVDVSDPDFTHHVTYDQARDVTLRLLRERQAAIAATLSDESQL